MSSRAVALKEHKKNLIKALSAHKKRKRKTATVEKDVKKYGVPELKRQHVERIVEAEEKTDSKDKMDEKEN